VIHDAIDLGIAVDTERGLLVPVLRNADRKAIREIAIEIESLAERARNGKLAADELSGSTFSITNLGGIGGTSFTPLVNPPEVAILGLSRIRSTPVWRSREEAPVERLSLPLSLSYDHRAVDGADAARFTRKLAALLESPLSLSRWKYEDPNLLRAPATGVLSLFIVVMLSFLVSSDLRDRRSTEGLRRALPRLPRSRSKARHPATMQTCSR